MYEKYVDYAENIREIVGSTLARHRHNFKNHIKPFYQGIDMKNVTIEEHETFLSKLKKKDLSSASRNRVRSLLMVMYNVAIKKHYFSGAIKINPFFSIEPAKEQRKQIDYWSKSAIHQFLKANEESPYYLFFLFLLNTGLRIGEAVGFSDEQVDLTAGIVTVDRTWSDSENKLVFRTKGQRFRTVGLNDMAAHALSASLKVGFVFTKPDQTPLTPNYVRKHVLPQACQKADVKDIGPHGFRHTFSAHYLMDGGTLHDLSRILGHSTERLTEQYYAHFSREHVVKRAHVNSLGGQAGKVIQADFRGGVVRGVV